jgi:hypothetical protein
MRVWKGVLHSHSAWSKHAHAPARTVLPHQVGTPKRSSATPLPRVCAPAASCVFFGGLGLGPAIPGRVCIYLVLVCVSDPNCIEYH